jgi:uncharacterized Zn-finger protein
MNRKFTDEMDDLLISIFAYIGEKPYKCPKCPRRFNQTGHLKRHLESSYTHCDPSRQSDSWLCRLCIEEFENYDDRLVHGMQQIRNQLLISPSNSQPN